MDERIEALLVSSDGAAELIGVSRAHFYALHSSGRLGPLPVRLGRRTLWRRSELQKWTEASCPPRDRWQEGIQN